MLNRTYLNVPIGIKYISDWENFNLPQGHVIVNKIVTGCGFTEYCLNNNIPTILCSPRKALLGNKHRQHKEDGRPTYLYRNKYDQEENVDNSSQERLTFSKKIEDKNDILQYNRDLQNYIYQCTSSINIIPKILVTYDSLKHVLESINEIDPNLINNFQVVVDEFQSIFSDASFKAATELDFVDFLQVIPNVCYLSATPVLDKYLSELDEFKNLPYYELVWDKSMITKPVIDRRAVRSIPEACCNIIQEYKNGIYPRKYYNNQIIESKEVVFFINSVTDICKIIKKSNLSESEVNVICAEDPKNLKKLKKVGISSFGTVPLEGDPHKMFTFCTRTVYLGTDFYSPMASTVICSDSNIDCLALDVSQDLPQIMGRQRLESNVFRDRATLFYKEKKDGITKEEFDAKIAQKIEATLKILNTYSNMDEDGKKIHNVVYRDRALLMKYKDDYIGIQDSTSTATYNKLVELRDRRSWEIKEQYKDGKALYYAMSDEGFKVSEYISKRKELFDSFFKEFFRDKAFPRRMKLYCEFVDTYLDGCCDCLRKTKIPKSFHLYYTFIGSQKIRSVSYQESLLKDIVSDAKKRIGGPLVEEIDNAFSVGDKIPLQKIKDNLL